MVAMKDRSEVAEKVSWEGGLVASLEYGLTVADMPEDDPELRAAWDRMRTAWLDAVPYFSRVENILAGRGDIDTLTPGLRDNTGQ